MLDPLPPALVPPDCTAHVPPVALTVAGHVGPDAEPPLTIMIMCSRVVAPLGVIATNSVDFTHVPDVPLTALAVYLLGGSNSLFTTTCSPASATASATFTDANPFAPLSDFPLANVTIFWGDGTSSNATSITQPGGGKEAPATQVPRAAPVCADDAIVNMPTRDKLAQLGKLKGAAFDKAYVENEVAYHKTVDNALETQLIPSASNEELRGLLQTGLKIFQGHEQHAEHVEADLK